MTELMKDDSSKSVIPRFEKAWYGKMRDSDPTKRYGHFGVFQASSKFKLIEKIHFSIVLGTISLGTIFMRIPGKSTNYSISG